MPATLFAIAARHREHENQIADASDFALGDGAACEVQRVFEDPACTLYCLDAAHQRALFVLTPPSIELHEAPFLYQAQFQHAERIIAVAYEDLIRAAAEQEAPATRISFLYSVGRCGSTLLGRALNSLAGVSSLGEPDAPLGCIATPPGIDQAALLQTSIRLLCKSRGPAPITHHVIKLRHVGIKLGGALQRVFPESQALFLYRNAVDMVQSSLRAFHPLPLKFREYHEDPIRFVTRAWQSVMQQYLKLHRGGAAIRAVRYEDLVRDPRQTFAEVCHWYGIAGTDFAKADAIFALDAQAGSNLSRENLRRRSVSEFGSAADIERKVRAALASHAELNHPDFVVPGTLASHS